MSSFTFRGFVSMPGEEFNPPGVVPDPSNPENCLYPIWAETLDRDDVETTVYWLFARDGDMFVCPVICENEEWDADMDNATWICVEGNYENESENILDLYNNVKAVCETLSVVMKPVESVPEFFSPLRPEYRNVVEEDGLPALMEA